MNFITYLLLQGDEVEYHKKSAGVWVEAIIAKVKIDDVNDGAPFYTVRVLLVPENR